MSALWSQYSSKLVEHFKEPRNAGIIKDADGIGCVGDPSWGIDMELYIKAEGDLIVDAKFKTFGCGPSIATGSVVTEMVKGKSTGEALAISDRMIADALGGLPAAKTHCASLGQELIRSAINDYLNKKGIKG